MSSKTNGLPKILKWKYCVTKIIKKKIDNKLNIINLPLFLKNKKNPSIKNIYPKVNKFGAKLYI